MRFYQKLTVVFLLVFTSVVYTAGNDEIGRYSLSGYVTDAATGEALIGATVYIKELNIGTATNVYGFYSVSLDPGTYTIEYMYIGYGTLVEQITLEKDITKNATLTEASEELEEVVVMSERKDKNVTSLEMSVEKVEMKKVKRMPVLLGEVDIIKTIQLMPGVQTSVEGSSGFYVRGGNADQNLILLDNATVYNPAHLFGFFSVFNGDAVSDVKLYKGGIPAEYGGRLSSVLNVKMKEGNNQRFSAEGGIGTISSRLTVQGPIIKDRVSFIISARRTYADLLLAFSKDTLAKQSTVFFYDLNAKINAKINDNNTVFLSGYLGRDINEFGSLYGMNYGNHTFTARWNHIYSGKLFSHTTLLYSNFNYVIGIPQGTYAFEWISNIIDYSFKNHYTWYLNPSNTVKFGFDGIYHTLLPGESKPIGESSIFQKEVFPKWNAIEGGIYASNEHRVTHKISANYGLRLSTFMNIGKAKYYEYNDEYQMVDSVLVNNGDIFNTEYNLEPRINVRYLINKKNSVKASYNRMSQYLHLASNSTATFPLDLWFMSSPNVKPQKLDQVAVGYFRNFFDNMLESSVELYYKKIYNSIDFADHASLVANKYLEAEVRTGNTKAYGLELAFRKNLGDLTGWISYTYARAYRYMPELNDGKRYPAPYDKPHNVSVVLSYDMPFKFGLIPDHVGGTWVYSSPIPVTVPEGGYYYGNLWLPDYSQRGGYRIPGTAYHRLDASLIWDFHIGKKFLGDINLSVYNIYNRKNTFAIYFQEKDYEDEENPSGEREVEVIKVYLFPIVPSLTINFKF